MSFQRCKSSFRDDVPWLSKTSCLCIFGIFGIFGISKVFGLNLVRTTLILLNLELDFKSGSAKIRTLNRTFGPVPKSSVQTLVQNRTMTSLRVVWALGMFLFSFFRVLYILSSGFLFYLGCIYVLYAQEGFGWTAITKTGPNDIRHVVWALGTIFLIFNLFSRVLYILTNGFLFYLGCIYVLQAREGFGWTAMTKTGPNDSRHVVWALGIYLNLCKCMQPIAVPMVYPRCTHTRSTLG